MRPKGFELTHIFTPPIQKKRVPKEKDHPPNRNSQPLQLLTPVSASPGLTNVRALFRLIFTTSARGLCYFHSHIQNEPL